MQQYIYLISALCFIFALKGLSSHNESKMGNIAGIAGMSLALFAAIFFQEFHHQFLAISAIAAGGIVGAVIALNIQMTSLPQLVAAFHSLVGLAAVFVAFSAYLTPESLGIGFGDQINSSSLVEMSLGSSVGAITFTGSVIAFAKLHGIMPTKIIKFPGQQYVSISTFFGIVALIFVFVKWQQIWALMLLVLLSFIIGVLLIIPVGGADMPVIVSMLNSYSGIAAAGIGFTLQSNLLIITGSLVASSGAILSYIMCNAMNRSLFNVIFGAFLPKKTSSSKEEDEEKVVNPSSSEDAAFTISNSSSVVIVPGYGMAVAQAQHAIKDLTNLIKEKDIDVKFAIHPVAGRMPGHMNVLLAEANIPYELVYELDEINNEFSITDVVIVIGANDITNPAAKNDPESPIYGMQIAEVSNAQNVFFIKRSTSPGYAGIDNELFYNQNTFMLFGDAKKVVEDIIKSLKDQFS